MMLIKILSLVGLTTITNAKTITHRERELIGLDGIKHFSRCSRPAGYRIIYFGGQDIKTASKDIVGRFFGSFDASSDKKVVKEFEDRVAVRSLTESQITRLQKEFPEVWNVICN